TALAHDLLPEAAALRLGTAAMPLLTLVRSWAPVSFSDAGLVAGASAFLDLLAASAQAPSAETTAGDAPVETPAQAEDETEPLTVTEIARLFGRSRRAMGKDLAAGRVKARRMSRQAWRVVLRDIPPQGRERLQEQTVRRLGATPPKSG